MKNFYLFISTIVLCLLTAPNLYSVADPDTIEASDDAHTYSSNLTKNTGSWGNLAVKNSGSEIRYIYVKFDLRGLTNVAETVIYSFTSKVSDSTQNNTLGLHMVNSTDWSESTLNWENQPDFTVDPFTTVDVLTKSYFSEYQVDLTQTVKNLLFSGDSILSFALKAKTSSYILFDVRASENSNADEHPRLFFTYKDVSANQEITLSAESLDFDELVLGDSAKSSLTIYNEGSLDLVIDSIVLDGNNDYKISSIINLTVKPLKLIELEVNLKPTTEGEKDATITIYSDDPVNATIEVPLIGKCIDPRPIISSSHENIDFGMVVVGETEIKNLIITNTGSLDLTIDSVIFSGNNSVFFYDDIASDSTLKPDGSLTMELHFSPVETGEIEAELIFLSNDSNTDSLAVNLTGIGMPSKVESDTVLYCTDDTYTYSGEPDTPVGSKDFMYVKFAGSTSTYHRIAFIKFDLNSLTDLPMSAILEISTNETAGAPLTDSTKSGVFQISDDTWMESTLTWNTQPMMGTVIDSFYISATGDQEVYNYDRLDITKEVYSEFLGDKIISLALDGLELSPIGTPRVASSEYADYTLHPKIIFSYTEDLSYLTNPAREAETGIFERQYVLPSNIKLYPNPARVNDYINVELSPDLDKNFMVHVYNSTGRLISQMRFDNLNGETVQLDTNQWVPGMYVINVQTENVIFSNKILITR